MLKFVTYYYRGVWDQVLNSEWDNRIATTRKSLWLDLGYKMPELLAANLV